MSAHVLVHLVERARGARPDRRGDRRARERGAAATLPYYSTEAALVAFALAVQYDRDEQHGAAFEVLDRMQTRAAGPDGDAGADVSSRRCGSRPAEDQHYYLGLLYEAVGNYTEARAEWALYAAAGDLPYRGRALDHIAAIDALRRAAGPQRRSSRRVAASAPRSLP